MNTTVKSTVPYIRSASGITVVIKGRPHSLAKTDKNYEEVVQALKDGLSEDAVSDIINKAVQALQTATQVSPDISINGGVVYYQGKPVHNTLAERMLKMLEEEFDLAPMANFMANLMKNPSYRAVNELYSFLEKGNMPITPDGHFMAYKAVREDYKDIHSGTFDNSVGQVCEMDRNGVDENRDRTCSHGLHFCSFDYLSEFAQESGHVMLLKINPADVVSIPSDHNDAKGRCCRYEVVDEYADYYEKQEHIFTHQVYNPNGAPPAPAQFHVIGFTGANSTGSENLLGVTTSWQAARDTVTNAQPSYGSYEIRDAAGNTLEAIVGNTAGFTVKLDGAVLKTFSDATQAKHYAVDLDESGSVTVEDITGKVIMLLG